jgi:hypothetical protein
MNKFDRESKCASKTLIVLLYYILDISRISLVRRKNIIVSKLLCCTGHNQ